VVGFYLQKENELKYRLVVLYSQKNYFRGHPEVMLIDSIMLPNELKCQKAATSRRWGNQKI
jgi:hypothetical protein